jgi:hypothetical protein
MTDGLDAPRPARVEGIDAKGLANRREATQPRFAIRAMAGPPKRATKSVDANSP